MSACVYYPDVGNLPLEKKRKGGGVAVLGLGPSQPVACANMSKLVPSSSMTQA